MWCGGEWKELRIVLDGGDAGKLLQIQPRNLSNGPQFLQSEFLNPGLFLIFLGLEIRRGSKIQQWDALAMCTGSAVVYF